MPVRSPGPTAPRGQGAGLAVVGTISDSVRRPPTAVPHIQPVVVNQRAGRRDARRGAGRAVFRCSSRMLPCPWTSALGRPACRTSTAPTTGGRNGQRSGARAPAEAARPSCRRHPDRAARTFAPATGSPAGARRGSRAGRGPCRRSVSRHGQQHLRPDLCKRSTTLRTPSPVSARPDRADRRAGQEGPGRLRDVGSW